MDFPINSVVHPTFTQAITHFLAQDSSLLISVAPSLTSIDSSVSYLHFPMLPINLSFIVKLDEANYLIWQEKIKHVIIAYNLQAALPSEKVIKKGIQNITSSRMIQDCEVLEENLAYR